MDPFWFFCGLIGLTRCFIFFIYFHNEHPDSNEKRENEEKAKDTLSQKGSQLYFQYCINL